MQAYLVIFWPFDKPLDWPFGKLKACSGRAQGHFSALFLAQLKTPVLRLDSGLCVCPYRGGLEPFDKTQGLEVPERQEEGMSNQDMPSSRRNGSPDRCLKAYSYGME